MATVSRDFRVKNGLVVGSKIQTAVPTTTIAPLNIPHGNAPSSPVNGDIWSTTAGVFARINGTTVGPFGAGGSSVSVSDTAPVSPSTGNLWYKSDTGQTFIYYDSFWVEVGNSSFTSMSNPFTTTGDTLYAISGSTPARLGIGTAGQAYVVNSGATAPAWTTLTLENLPGAFVKRSVRAATTANIATLAGGAPNTIDGVTLAANDRILVKDQTSSQQNGIYVVQTLGTGANGTWVRSADADAIGELASAMVAVDEGTVSGGFTFDNDLKATDTLGTTAFTWNRVVDSGYSMNIGTTAVQIGRASGALTLGGITLTAPTFTSTITTSLTTAGYVTTTAGGVLGSVATIPNAGLTNSSVTIGSTAVSLGGTAATVAGLTLTSPVIDTVAASAAGATPVLWSTVTTGSIGIGQGLTTGALNIATVGTGATPISIGHTNATIGITGNTTITGTLTITGNLDTNLTTAGVVTTNASGVLSSSASLGVANGGTGLTATPTNGQLAIGNGSGYTLATISQGTGITITNGAGTISVGLTNSSITVGSTAIALGASSTTIAGLTQVSNTGPYLTTGATAANQTATGAMDYFSTNNALRLIAWGPAATNPNVEFWAGQGGAAATRYAFVNSTGMNVTGTVTATTFSGSGASLTNIPNGALTNSSVTVNGTAISLGGSGTVTAAAGTLTGTTLNSTVTGSSLTSVGTITTGVWNAGAVTSSGLVTATGGIAAESWTKDDLTTRTQSGFIQTSTATTAEGWPETTNNWYHLIAATHANVANYYSLQIAGSFFDQGLYFRKTNSASTTGATQTWRKFATVETDINTQTASYQLVFEDRDKIVEMNVGSANNVTVPPNSTVAFPIGTSIDVIQYGTGQTTIVAGAGVTIRSSNGLLKLSGQYAAATLYKRGTDEWVAIGDLV